MKIKNLITEHMLNNTPPKKIKCFGSIYEYDDKSIDYKNESGTYLIRNIKIDDFEQEIEILDEYKRTYEELYNEKLFEILELKKVIYEIKLLLKNDDLCNIEKLQHIDKLLEEIE